MKVVLKVFCNNSALLDDSLSVVFIAELDEEIRTRIMVLASAVKLVGADQIEEVNSVGDYYEVDQNIRPDQFKLLEELVGSSIRTGCNLLKVTPEAFKFSCYPKHAGADTLLTTAEVPIDKLDADSFLSTEQPVQQEES